MASREEYEALLRRSRGFYETSLLQAERGYYDLAAFSLEQALQLFPKSTPRETRYRVSTDTQH